MLLTLILALFGLVSLLVAAEALRNGRATLKGVEFARGDRPMMFRLAVAIYVGLGLLNLAGAAWMVALEAGE